MFTQQNQYEKDFYSLTFNFHFVFSIRDSRINAAPAIISAPENAHKALKLP